MAGLVGLRIATAMTMPRKIGTSVMVALLWSTHVPNPFLKSYFVSLDKSAYSRLLYLCEFTLVSPTELWKDLPQECYLEISKRFIPSFTHDLSHLLHATAAA